MNVLLDEHFGKLVKQMLESGEFSSDTEVVQAGLQLLEKRQQKLEALRRDIQEGLASGVLAHSTMRRLSVLSPRGAKSWPKNKASNASGSPTEFSRR